MQTDLGVIALDGRMPDLRLVVEDYQRCWCADEMVTFYSKQRSSFFFMNKKNYYALYSKTIGYCPHATNSKASSPFANLPSHDAQDIPLSENI